MADREWVRVSAAAWERIQRVIHHIERMAPDLRQAAGGRPEPGRPRPDGWWGRVTGSDPADDPAQNRWLYSLEEVYKSATGYGGWAALAGGRSVTGSRTAGTGAYHLAENGNTGSGTEMVGVNVDDLPGTFAIQPVAVGQVVRVFNVPVQGGIEFWFTAGGNGIDGEC